MCNVQELFRSSVLGTKNITPPPLPTEYHTWYLQTLTWYVITGDGAYCGHTACPLLSFVSATLHFDSCLPIEETIRAIQDEPNRKLSFIKSVGGLA